MGFGTILIFVLILQVTFSSDDHLVERLDDVELLILHSGHQVKSHQVLTNDGFYLTLHHIYPETNNARNSNVLFMHGLFTTAADFLVVGKDRALPYLLVNNGFDVWLANTRGSDFGLTHKTLDINTDEFWNFTFHEIGVFDLRAHIDFVLNATSARKLFFVTHCQGAAAFAALLSEHPDYSEKVMQAHLFAPTIFFSHFDHPVLTLLIRLYGDFAGIYRMDSIHMAFAGDETMIQVMKIVNNRVTEFFCSRGAWTSPWCRLRLNSIVGFNQNERETDSENFPEILNHLSSQASIKQFSHFAQIYLSGKFRQYDYYSGNLQLYNASEPPDYRLESVRVPVYIYYGGSDPLVNRRDVEDLSKVLPNVIRLRFFENYNHFDFNHGKYSKTYFYVDIVDAFKMSST